MTAAFVPPPVEVLMDCLGDWENFLHSQDVIPDLITFFLMQRGRLSEPLLYLSAFIDAHKGDYYDLLQRVRTHGDWVPWIRFFLQGVTEIATEAGQQSKELHRLREQYRSQLRDKPNALGLIDELFVNPYMTIGRGAKVLNKTHPTAKAAISVLEEKKILKEVSGRQWGRFYVCAPVLDALEKPFH